MRLISSLIFCTLVLFSCKKEEPEIPTPVDAFSNGLLILNEGLFQQNNSTLSWVDLATDVVNNSIFEQKTSRQLGDTGNDIARYGNKIYIVVNVSSTVEVLDALSGAPLTQIQMSEGGVPKQPRSIAFAHGKAFVTCYDGFVDVIDTINFTVLQRIQVGANPEQILFTNEKLYVTNSGGLNYPNVDSTVSVIDPTSFIEITKITIGNNPGGLEVDHLGNLYAIARGNYSSIPSRMVRINTGSNTVENTYSFNASGITRMNDHLLIHSITNSNSSILLFNPLTETIENPNFINVSGITTLYGIQYDPTRHQIYCFDAMNYTNSGYVRLFSASGNYLRSIHVGLNPSKALIYD